MSFIMSAFNTLLLEYLMARWKIFSNQVVQRDTKIAKSILAWFLDVESCNPTMKTGLAAMGGALFQVDLNSEGLYVKHTFIEKRRMCIVKELLPLIHDKKNSNYDFWNKTELQPIWKQIQYEAHQLLHFSEKDTQWLSRDWKTEVEPVVYLKKEEKEKEKEKKSDVEQKVTDQSLQVAMKMFWNWQKSIEKKYPSLKLVVISDFPAFDIGHLNMHEEEFPLMYSSDGSQYLGAWEQHEFIRMYFAGKKGTIVYNRNTELRIRESIRTKYPHTHLPDEDAYSLGEETFQLGLVMSDPRAS
jgi:hypothetical protein